MNYFDVPAELLDDAEELSRWAKKSQAVALKAANAKGARKTKSARKRATQKTAKQISGGRAKSQRSKR